jgi:hypothetical protein
MSEMRSEKACRACMEKSITSPGRAFIPGVLACAASWPSPRSDGHWSNEDLVALARAIAP